MGAQPAWPPRSTPRLFVETALAAGPLRLDGAAAHYLVAVMRIRPGDPVKLFDDATGEWLAVAATVGKRDLTLDVTERLRAREAVPDLWLVAAPDFTVAGVTLPPDAAAEAVHRVMLGVLIAQIVRFVAVMSPVWWAPPMLLHALAVKLPAAACRRERRARRARRARAAVAAVRSRRRAA